MSDLGVGTESDEIKPRSWTVDSLKEHQFSWVLLAPSLFLLLLLVGWPVVYSLFLSFHKVIISGGTTIYEFVGIGNYAELFADTRFRQAFRQTVLFTTVRVIGVMVISMILALLLNRSGKFVELFKRLFLLPWVLSYVVNALMWGWIFHGGYGLLNGVLLKLGLISEYKIWLADPTWALWVLIAASIWKGVPFAGLMSLAALKTVPQELYDAARVDGAGVWSRFRYVTLPWIKPVTVVILVIQTMWSLRTFELIWVLTEGGPVDKTMLLSVFTYQETWRFFRFGYGAAAAYLITGLTLVLTVAYFKLLHGFDD